MKPEERQGSEVVGIRGQRHGDLREGVIVFPAANPIAGKAMRLLHYVEIENFKRFSEKQRIELDHPAVLIWTISTARVKLSDFAEQFYRRLGKVTGMPMLLRKGDLHLLIPYVDPKEIVPEVREKLIALQRLLTTT